METSQIESLIALHSGDEQAVQDLNDLLAVIAENNGEEPDEAELQRGAKFVMAYVEQVPYMLKVAMTAATNVGLENEMGKILVLVSSYWEQDLDIIPDHLGIIGLLDDAYCSLLSMQTMSDFYQLQTGKFLFPDDLTAANSIMRKIIGEPYATELDNIVSKAVLDANIKEAVKLLASPEKQQLFENQATIWNHGPVQELEIGQLTGLGLTEDE